MVDVEYIESQLKKRLPYKNRWYRKQDDLWDRRSSFIYETPSWEVLIKKMEAAVNRFDYEKKPYFYYTVNRWYNYWSAVAVEQLFTQSKNITANPNPRENHYDFIWHDILFDHKTSVFPKKFEDDFLKLKNVTLSLSKGDNTGINENISTAYAFAKAHPKHLAQWLYTNQSTGQRFHLKNRLFIIAYARDGAHYKIKAEIGFLKTVIQAYINTFDPSNLIQLDLQSEQQTLTDIIWAER